MQPKLNLPPLLEPLSLCRRSHEKLPRPQWSTWHSFSQTRSEEIGSGMQKGGGGGHSLPRRPSHLLVLLDVVGRIRGKLSLGLWAGMWREDPTSHLFCTSATNYCTQHVLRRSSTAFPTSETGVRFANTSMMTCDIPCFHL